MFRRMLPALAIVFAMAASVASPAFAQDAIAITPSSLTMRADAWRVSFAPEPSAVPAALAVRFDDVVVALERAAVASEDVVKERPSMLMTSLYATTALLQGLDAHSTFKAIDAGAVEKNPLMAGLTKHRPVFVAVKTGAAAGLIFAGRRLAKSSRLHTVIALVAIDTVYAFIVVHNYRVAGRLERAAAAGGR